MRFASGLSFAEVYVVCESWMNERAISEIGGQLLPMYMVITIAGMGISQMMIFLGRDGSSSLFLLGSVMVSIAVVPILITASVAPSFEAPKRISFLRLVRVLPLAVVGMTLIGVMVSMVFGMGTVYGRLV